MADTIGKLFRVNTPKPGKQPVPAITAPQPVAFQPAPDISLPGQVAFQPPPDINLPGQVAFQPAPEPSSPAQIEFQRAPSLSAPAVISAQPAPELNAPASASFQPAPELAAPARVEFQPPPALELPEAVPFEPAPELSAPAAIPFEPPPELSAPPVIPFEPPPELGVPEVIPFEPPPELSAPSPVDFQPAPETSTPAVIPFQEAPATTAPAAIPFQSASALRAPAPIPPPPPSTPGPRTHEDRVRSETAVVQVGGLGANVGLTYSGRISLGFDPHIKEVLTETLNNAKNAAIIKAQQLAQQQVDRALKPATDVLRNVQSGVEQLIRNTNPFELTSKPFLEQSAERAPGGNLIDPLDAAAFRTPTAHDPPSTIEIEDYPVEAADPDFDYAKTSRQHAQAEQAAQALRLESDLNKYNSWNDEWQYQDIVSRSTGTSPDLLKANRPTADGENALSSIIQSPKGVDTKGYFVFDGTEQSLPSDDSVYVPLVFTDMRPNAAQSNQLRSVYFRPLIKGLSETFAPQWNMGNYFGRVDPVATYKSTDRTISLSFKIACFGPEDLAANYRKIAWLSSMCYPQYRGGSYFAGPVIRLRVGDVISAIGGTTGKGLSGIITSLDYNYDEAVWEVSSGQKLPRDIDVSIGFHVLHDAAIGLVSGSAGVSFGGITGNSADVRRFRAAFGTVEYVNDNPPALPGASLVPNVAPIVATPILGDFPSSAAVPSLTDGSQPGDQTIRDAMSGNGWTSSNVDEGLGLA